MQNLKIGLTLGCLITFFLSKFLKSKIEKLIDSSPELRELFKTEKFNYYKLYIFIKNNDATPRSFKYLFWAHEINFIVMLIIFIFGLYTLISQVNF